MINWQYFPKSHSAPDHLRGIVSDFERNLNNIDSQNFTLSSNEVLEKLRGGLQELGFKVETGKKHIEKIKVPVLFGRNGSLEKSFDADGYNSTTKTVIEIEAGRGVTNFQFLKDLFQACMMHDVEYLCIAVRNLYIFKKDFETVVNFFDTLYASNRLSLPLKGILIIGY
ncbi:hypothetical protein HNQ91_003418 [Filimonas zeae]|uniref:hypothetical protein n=1 Tax=Filimonas zeae TaxID=1737353 RepID=UPI00166784AD|nr:hypothetical protein [Filimonas zeae]MDR6340353.1 hypothetical protein [Filimonas zeae]